MLFDTVFRSPAPSASIPVSRGGVDAPEAIGTTDITIAAALGLAALALYIRLGLRLARGEYLDYYNLAFDFDPAKYLGTFALSPADPGNFKHPLILLLRPLAMPFLALGFDAKQASVLVMTGFGGATVVVCFLFLRVIRTGRPEAAALTAMFAVTGTQLFTSIIAESYSPAGFGIAALWLVAASRLADGGSRVWQRYALGVFCFGVTLTNVMQVFVAELLVSLRSVSLFQAVRRAIVFGIILFGIIVILSVAVWHRELAAMASHPVLALKEIYWLRTKGDRTGALQVVKTFLGYSFVSPEYDYLHLPEGIDMRDFRGWRFSPVGTVAIWSWLSFLAVGAISAVSYRRTRFLASGMAASLVLNILFHLDFQFRGSLYIYAAHMHFLVFALAAGLAPWIRPMRLARVGYVWAVLALTVLIGADNLPIVDAFTRAFDDVQISCPAPCTEVTPQ